MILCGNSILPSGDRPCLSYYEFAKLIIRYPWWTGCFSFLAITKASYDEWYHRRPYVYTFTDFISQGLYVSQNEAKACSYYEAIVDSDKPYAEIDDYYWRACYRLALAHHYGQGTEKDFAKAIALISKAKDLHRFREDAEAAGDITQEEFEHEWLLLHQDAGTF